MPVFVQGHVKVQHSNRSDLLLPSSILSSITFVLPCSIRLCIADMASVLVSDSVSDFARLPAMMIVGDAHQTSSTRSEPISSSVQHQNASPHIRFRGGPPEYTTQQDGEHYYDHRNHHLEEEPQPTDGLPPPSPRLEPTYRSAVSLNGSIASSPSRIKVRDLEHIQSFASEELLTRSRHPSRHSLRGRLAGGQQYEISAMPVGDIIEMVAGLLTKITTKVGFPLKSSGSELRILAE